MSSWLTHLAKTTDRDDTVKQFVTAFPAPSGGHPISLSPFASAETFGLYSSMAPPKPITEDDIDVDLGSECTQLPIHCLSLSYLNFFAFRALTYASSSFGLTTMTDANNLGLEDASVYVETKKKRKRKRKSKSKKAGEDKGENAEGEGEEGDGDDSDGSDDEEDEDEEAPALEEEAPALDDETPNDGAESPSNADAAAEQNSSAVEEGKKSDDAAAASTESAAESQASA
jgi:hypothetical protein